MVALAAGGCTHGRSITAAQPPAASASTDLDSFAYTRRTAAPTTALAQARYQQQPAQQGYAQQPYRQGYAQQPYARQPSPQPPLQAVQARAQAVPVVAQPLPEPSYALDTGDKLRIVVFGQDGLSNSYFVDAAGQVTMPLIGPVTARGLTTQQFARAIADRLRNGFIREPHVAIEVETYRPFFILGEVTQPGQYPYVPNMTVETAVAIAGGYTPRAYRWSVQIDRPAEGGTLRSRGSVPLLTKIRPGDTIIIKERWF
jgi:polysaccharide export outer membrane protein